MIKYIFITALAFTFVAGFLQTSNTNGMIPSVLTITAEPTGIVLPPETPSALPTTQEPGKGIKMFLPVVMPG